jgi:hypothetical protein
MRNAAERSFWTLPDHPTERGIGIDRSPLTARPSASTPSPISHQRGPGDGGCAATGIHRSRSVPVRLLHAGTDLLERSARSDDRLMEPAGANRVALADGRTAAAADSKCGCLRVRQNRRLRHPRLEDAMQRNTLRAGRSASPALSPLAASSSPTHSRNLHRRLPEPPPARGDRTGGTGDRELCDVRHARSGRSKLLRMRPLLPPHGISPADPWLPRTAPRHRRRIRIRLSAS